MLDVRLLTHDTFFAESCMLNLSLIRPYPRPIESDSVFYETERKVWAEQTFLVAHIVLPKGQHLLS